MSAYRSPFRSGPRVDLGLGNTCGMFFWAKDMSSSTKCALADAAAAGGKGAGKGSRPGLSIIQQTLIKLGRDPYERVSKAPNMEEIKGDTDKEMAASSMRELSLAVKQVITAGECAKAKQDRAALPAIG